jgi:hypothetical protein
MKTSHQASPFDLLLNPEGVLRAVESSQPLGGLRSTVFRPLDRPSSGASASGDQGADEDDNDDFGPEGRPRG